MITVCRQPVSLGRIHAGRIVRVHVAENTLAIELYDETRTVRRTRTGNGASPTDCPGSVLPVGAVSSSGLSGFDTLRLQGGG